MHHTRRGALSDLTQRPVPAAVIRASPDQPVIEEDFLALAEALEPTPFVTEER